MHRPPTALVAALALAAAAPALADPPTILAVRPLGVRRGEATEVSITGANFEGNPRLVAPFAVAASTTTKADGSTWSFRLEVAPDATVGVYSIRVRTDDGISNPMLLAVGQVPQMAESEENSPIESAQPVPTPIVVEGSVAGNDVDFFRFAGKKGQRVVVDAQCARIGSGVDPQIRLTTASRAFVAASEDAPGLGTDARISATLPADGDYVVELSDTKYQGGGRPVYRLLIGAVPVADEVYPLGGRRGETIALELRGGTVGEAKLPPLPLLGPPESDSARIRVSSAALGGSEGGLDLDGSTALALSDLTEYRESTEAAAGPTRGAAPGVFNGRIDPAGDEDRFEVEVQPNARYRIEVSATDLGSSLDGILTVSDEKGAVLATADDSTTPAAPPRGRKARAPGLVSLDPSLQWSSGAAAKLVTIAIRDLEGRGGVGFPYRIRFERDEPGFHLALAAPQASLPVGGSAAIAASVARSGYDGPIELAVVDPPPGIAHRVGTIPGGQSAGSLTLSAGPDAPDGPIALTVVGRATGPSGPIVEVASTQVVFSKIGPLPVAVEAYPGLLVARASAGPVRLETPADRVEVAHGSTVPVAVHATRDAGAAGALTFEALPASAGLSISGGGIGEAAADGAVSVAVGPDAPLGPASMAVVAKGTIAGKARSSAAPEIALTVVRPVVVEPASPSIEIRAGGSVDLTGRLVRRGGSSGAAGVAASDLPAGVKAESTKVEGDSFVVKLVADPGAAAADVQIKIAPTMKIGGKDYATPPTAVGLKITR